MTSLPPPGLASFANLAVRVGPAHEIGSTLAGNRRVIPLLGREVSGERWKGRLVPGGGLPGDRVADLGALCHRDGCGGPDLRGEPDDPVGIGGDDAEADSGEPVDPKDVYFRCVPGFEMSAAALRWLMNGCSWGRGLGGRRRW